MLKTLIKEPLVHFLVLGLAVFLLYGALNPSDKTSPDEIVITSARIEQLTGLYAKTWQRPPSAQELKGLIDDYVKEEIYYREAMALGLDTDDTVIRRRLRQKMEFVSDAEVGALTPTDAELDAHLKAHVDRFRIEPVMTFQHIFLNPAIRGVGLTSDAQAMLAQLRADPETDPATLGDQTLLPVALPPTGQMSIERTFGAAFADRLAKVPVNEWTGPVSSSYGVHLVRVSDRTDARNPLLAEVRDAVAREWGNDKRKFLEQQRLEALLTRYRVTIEPVATTEAQK